MLLKYWTELKSAALYISEYLENSATGMEKVSFHFNPKERERQRTFRWGEVKSLSRVRLFATPWAVAYQAPLSMGFSKQEYWSELPNMPANVENSAVATGLEKFSFHPNPKKGNAKECSNYCTIALISYTSKVMLKIFQDKLQQYIN